MCYPPDFNVSKNRKWDSGHTAFLWWSILIRCVMHANGKTRSSHPSHKGSQRQPVSGEVTRVNMRGGYCWSYKQANVINCPCLPPRGSRPMWLWLWRHLRVQLSMRQNLAIALLSPTTHACPYCHSMCGYSSMGCAFSTWSDYMRCSCVSCQCSWSCGWPTQRPNWRFQVAFCYDLPSRKINWPKHLIPKKRLMNSDYE